jgi:ATP-dependent Zn protease
MEESVSFLSVFISWVPMLVLIGSMSFIVSRINRTKSGKSQAQVLEENSIELRRQNDLLEKLVQSHETRIQRLEAQR